jgi:hypothetical protein
MKTHRFYSIPLLAILLFCTTGCNVSGVGGFNLTGHETLDPYSTSIEDRWLRTARDSLVAQSYVSSGSIYGCSEDCAHEEYGFANALLMSVTSDEACSYASFERVEHRNGCRAYLVALKQEIHELQKWLPKPDSVNLCFYEEQLLDRVTRLYEQSIGRPIEQQKQKDDI